MTGSEAVSATAEAWSHDKGIMTSRYAQNIFVTVE
jgi:hypothetical protein